MVVILVLIGLLTRLPFLSKWLEDWDSVQFALAMHHYSLTQGLPHPPGYPLYILLGRFFLLFTQNDNLALTLMSALLGSLAAVPLYLLTKELLDRKVAFWTNLVFLLIPVEWGLSEVALTNIPGQFFLLTLIYLLYHFRNNQQAIPIISLGFGLLLGFRFTEFPIIVSLLALSLIRFRKLKLILISSISFLIGILIWLTPLILITGLSEFIKVYTANASYIIQHDSLLNQEVHKSVLLARFKALVYLLQIGYGWLFIGLSIIAIGYLLINKAIQYRYAFIGVWLAAYLLPLLIFYNLEVARYTVPLAAPLSILLVSTIFILASRFKLVYLLLPTLIIILFIQGYDQVSRFHNQTPPVISAVNFVKQNYSPQDTLIVPTVTLRHFQYYAPEFRLLDLDKDPLVMNPKYKNIIIDYSGTKEKLGLNMKEKKFTFDGEKDIYNRVSSVTIYSLKPKSE